MMHVVLFTAQVNNVAVESLTLTSVKISWDNSESTYITEYVIYYKSTSDKGMNEKNKTVNGSARSVIITDLIIGNEYEFEVAAVAMVDGMLVSGFRSTSKKITLMAMVSESSPNDGLRKITKDNI